MKQILQFLKFIWKNRKIISEITSVAGVLVTDIDNKELTGAQKKESVMAELTPIFAGIGASLLSLVIELIVNQMRK